MVEIRRLPYNGLLLLIGVLSISGMELIASPGLETGQDAVLALSVAVYGVTANICYSLGWILELWGRKHDKVAARRRGGWMFRTGLLFSCALTSLPFWFACAWRLSRLLVVRFHW